MTTIHDFGFRGFDGERTSALARVLAISGSELRRIFKSKKFLVFFALCLGPAILALVLVWVRFFIIEGSGSIGSFRGGAGTRQLAQGGGLFGRQIGEVDFFFDILKGGSTTLTVIFSAVVGAGIISRDRHAGALEIYFTRGIGPWQYFAGKLLSVWFLLLCQVLFGFVLVWLFAVGVSSKESGYFAATVGFMPGLIAGQSFLCLTLAFWLCALSASTDSTRFALLRWVGALALLRVVGGSLRLLFQDPDWMLISPFQVVKRIAAALAGATPSELSLGGAVVVWAMLSVAALLWARRHLRPVEVVG